MNTTEISETEILAFLEQTYEQCNNWPSDMDSINILNPSNLTPEFIFNQMGLEKWVFANENEKRLCGEYLTGLVRKLMAKYIKINREFINENNLMFLAQEYAFKWLRDNQGKVVGDFEQASKARIEQERIEQKKRKKKKNKRKRKFWSKKAKA